MTLPKKLTPAKLPTALLRDVRAFILAAREQVARAVDSGLSGFYWHVGRRIHQDILHEQRAEYGQEIVSALRRELTWSHFKRLIYLDDTLKREFYTEMCRLERWSTRAGQENRLNAF